MATRFPDHLRRLTRSTLLLMACAASIATSRVEHWYQDTIPVDLSLEPGESVEFTIALDARLGAIPTGTDGASFKLNASEPIDAHLALLPDPDQAPEALPQDLGTLFLGGGEAWQASWDHDPLADCPGDAPCSRDYLLTIENPASEGVTQTITLSLVIDAPFDGDAVRPTSTNLRVVLEPAN